MEGFRIDQDYYVVKFTVPEKFVGYFVNELNLDEEFHLKMIGLKRANKVTNCLGISLTELHVRMNYRKMRKWKKETNWSATAGIVIFRPSGKLFS